MAQFSYCPGEVLLSIRLDWMEYYSALLFCRNYYKLTDEKSLFYRFKKENSIFSKIGPKKWFLYSKLDQNWFLDQIRPKNRIFCFKTYFFIGSIMIKWSSCWHNLNRIHQMWLLSTRIFGTQLVTPMMTGSVWLNLLYGKDFLR